jgi:hypothetical protein
MKAVVICSACHSERVIPCGRVIDHEEGYELDLNLQVCERPDVKLEKRSHYGVLRARVCGNCGHAELFVPEAGKLWHVYEKSLAPTDLANQRR